MLAAYGGQLEVVRFLLENGADIHVRTAEWIPVEIPLGTIYFQEIGGNALMLAIDQGHAEVARLLLEHWMWEYSADGRDDYGTSALMYAAAAGDLEMARLLLENGAPVNAQTDVGTTALMFAAAFGQCGDGALPRRERGRHPHPKWPQLHGLESGRREGASRSG